MGFSRQGYWNGLTCPSPGDLPDPGINKPSLLTMSTHITITTIKIQDIPVIPKSFLISLSKSIPTHPHQKHILIQRAEVFWTRLEFLFTNIYQALCMVTDPGEASLGKGCHMLEVVCCGGRFDLTSWGHCRPQLTASLGGHSAVLKPWPCPPHPPSSPVVPGSPARRKHRFLAFHVKGCTELPRKLQVVRYKSYLDLLVICFLNRLCQIGLKLSQKEDMRICWARRHPQDTGWCVWERCVGRAPQRLGHSPVQDRFRPMAC